MYKYRITVEALGSTRQPTTSTGQSTQFEVENHDDLFKIVEAVRLKEILDSDKSASLAIGLKLFSEVVLEKRLDPIFAPVLAPLHGFIRQLKTVRAVSAGEASWERPAAYDA